MKKSRRGVLSLLTAVGVSGCARFRPPIPSPGQGDSDGDGVLSREDYAPRDGHVSNRSDVWRVYNPAIRTPSSLSTVEHVLNSEPGNRLVESKQYDVPDGRGRPRWLSSISVSNDGTATVYIPYRAVERIENQECIIVSQSYPTGQVYSVSSANIKSRKAKFKFDTKQIDTNNTFYFTAYLVPEGKELDTLQQKDFTYLCETSPLISGKNKWKTIEMLDRNYENSILSRYSVAGGVVCTVDIPGEDSSIPVTYYVSKSAYYLRSVADRGRSRKEYITHLRNSNLYRNLTQTLVPELKNAIQEDDRGLVDFTIDFVQNLKYTKDSISVGFDDYTQYPLETLAVQMGDCEDTSLTLAVLLSALGEDVVLIEFPNHIGVGISGSYSGASASYNDNKYYYIETTQTGWGIGDFPESLSRNNVNVYNVPSIRKESK